MTLKQFYRQLKTWKREDRDIYEKIIDKANMMNVITKRGKISEAKNNKQKVNNFLSWYEDKVGSYSSYIKKAKERMYKEYSREEIKEKRLTVKEYARKSKELNDLILELFEKFPSSSAYEELQYIKTLDKTISIERLEKELALLQILPAQEYLKEHGNFNPPF